MAKRWRIHTHDADRIGALQGATGLPYVVAQLLVCRGVHDPDRARRFLDAKLSDLHDPERLPGCRTAAGQIHGAIAQGRRIVVYGDYDVDGVTGTAILRQCLHMLGANVGYYIPSRADEGYGLHGDAVRRLASEGAEWIVTVDCGIGSLEEAAVARELQRGAGHHRPPRAGAGASRRQRRSSIRGCPGASIRSRT